LVGKVVKGTSEVVDNVSGDKSNFDGRGLDIENAVQVISSLRVVLAFDSIRLTADEPIPSDFQIMEVLFRPFNFCVNERESYFGSHDRSG
jgi:hypothetical protein